MGKNHSLGDFFVRLNHVIIIPTRGNIPYSLAVLLSMNFSRE